jgi:hypothetical protein
VSDRRRAELKRIFGESVQGVEFSHLHYEPAVLVTAIKQAQADAVVYGTATPAHRAAIEALAREIPILQVRFERVRNIIRGEMEDRPAGLGLMQEGGEIEPLADGALTPGPA